VSDVAHGLGIHENLLHTWKRKYKEDPSGSFPGKGHLKPEEEQLKRLQKENANLKEDREILKKALAIFSKHPKWNTGSLTSIAPGMGCRGCDESLEHQGADITNGGDSLRARGTRTMRKYSWR